MRFRSLASLLTLCSILGLGVRIGAQDLGGTGLKENLDLPFDARGDGAGEDEDAPEVVSFYGQNLEGDGFFYTVDRSGSMQNQGELQRAKQEISRNISEFSSKTQFAVVFFDSGIQKFPTSGRPAEANAGMKGAALSWINNMRGGSGSCMTQGLRVALQFGNLASAKRKVIVYVGDGGGTCGGGNQQQYLQNMVSTITGQNYQRIQINCIGVLMNGRTTQRNYMKLVASANG
ncbi:MAG: VWA domain-containing protein, partial [Planctomycetota bacterium]|nr:VWA domain-containing protein [Planctomycetota bacterium]